MFMYICSFGICFSLFKQAHRWNNNDLEYILEKGDAMYKASNSCNLLKPLQLPKTLLIGNVSLHLKFQQESALGLKITPKLP